VIEGKDLAPKDKTGKSDPYVKIKAGSHKKKTKWIAQNLVQYLHVILFPSL
jgi:Ca2+-dependent lipid-binding protein